MRPPKDPNNPLRLLRVALQSAENPLSPRVLAKRIGIGISPSTIRSLECGRVSLSQKHLNMISSSLGAAWAGQRKEWWSILTGRQYCADDYKKWKEVDFDRKSEIAALCKGLESFLLAVDDGKFTRVSDEVYQTIFALAQKHVGSFRTQAGLKLFLELTKMDLRQEGLKRVRGAGHPDRLEKIPSR